MHHIEIYVSDIAKTRAFYDKLLVDELGFKVFQEWDKGVSYKQGAGAYLVFVQVDESKNDGAFNRTKVGLNHLAFRVNSRSKLDKMRLSYLQDADVSMLYDNRYPFASGLGHYALYMEDPDRIKIEIVAEEFCI